MGFFQEIFKLYNNIKVPEKNKEFYQLNKIVYYLADIDKEIIKANNVLEIDIQSAYPTICNLMFDKDNPFIIKLNSLENKLEKNIHISTSLKGTSELRQLNLLSKMIISSCLMDKDPNAVILELKKDGIVYMGQEVAGGRLFGEYKSRGISIRTNKYDRYVRYQRTSHFITKDNLIIKGIFKDRPIWLHNIIKDYLLNKTDNIDFLDKYYSNTYWNIIKYNNLDELFKKYYLCENNHILNRNFKYERVRNISACNILPKNYLKFFLYPLITE